MISLPRLCERIKKKEKALVYLVKQKYNETRMFSPHTAESVYIEIK